MTVTDGNTNPVPLTGDPRVDVLTLPTSNFSVQLETLASTTAGIPFISGCNPGTDPAGQFSGFAPALGSGPQAGGVFNCAATSTTPSQAVTSIQTGFFIDQQTNVDLSQVVGLLDAAEAKLDDINGFTSFLTTDWPAKWDSALNGLSVMEGKLDTIGPAVDNLSTVPNSLQSLSNQINQLVTTQALAYLLGIPGVPAPDGFPPIVFTSVLSALGTLEAKADALESKLDSLPLNTVTGALSALEGKADALEAKLDSVAATGKIDVEVLESSTLSDNNKVFVVQLSENGVPVAGDIFAVSAISTQAGQASVVALDIDTTELQTGLLLVDAYLPGSLSSTKIFVFRAEKTDSNIQGSKLVSLGPTSAK